MMLTLAHPLQHTTSDYRPPSSSSSSSRPSRHSSSRKHSLSSSSTNQSALASNSRSSPVDAASSSSHHRSSLPHSNLPPPKHLDPKQPQVEPQHEPVDIYAFPPQDLLRLLASLLTQIASANDSLSNNPPKPDTTLYDHSRSPIWKTLTTASKASLGNSSSSLSFHARNIPTITLESYLLRILKYCPTTNEVFLSLLVYFDRMSKLATQISGKPFVIDSYNIHRLVIAGVTVASKFFSDVFYTNSRYAKVGGLPQTELNQLELQFLLLNDFRLTISPEELQRYADQLIAFSGSTSDGSIPPIKTASGLTAPMQAMGAVDAYGGSLASTSPSNGYPKSGFRTPQMRPRQHSFASETDASDAETSEAGTETDVDGETDDEPTIRPAHSSCSSDTLSMYSAASEDTDYDDGGGGDNVSNGRMSP